MARIARDLERYERSPAPRRDTGERAWRSSEACSLVGITYRRLDYWARTGLVVPAITEAQGSGSARRYSWRNLVELKLVERLVDAGFSHFTARRAIAALGEAEHSEAPVLVIAGGKVLVAHSGDSLSDVLTDAETAGVLAIVPLDAVAGELRQERAQLEAREQGALPRGA